MRSLLLDQVARGILPMLLLFSAFLLVRGHDAPGGGFVAGLVTATAAVLAALAFGVAGARRTIVRVARPLPWIGLVVAALSGLVAVVRGDAFLTHEPLRGPLAIPTTMIFDAGVYLVVAGATILILAAFSRGARG
jgi:multisubunit Na+/H+ antiporter MnhB subunit